MDWYVSERRLDWKTVQNPVAGGHLALMRESGKVIGSASTTPRAVRSGDARLLGAEIGDTYTDPLHRRRGVFSRCVAECLRACQEADLRLVYGCPNDQALPGYVRKLGFTVCRGARVSFLARFTSIRDVRRLVGKKVDNDLVVRAAAWPAWHCLRPHRRSPQSCLDSIGLVTSFPESTDPLWGWAGSGYTYVGERSAPYLTWRFFEHPEALRYRVIGAWGLRGDLLGYVALKLSIAKGIRECAVVDLMTERQDASVAGALLDYVSAHESAWHVDVMKTYVSEASPYRECFRRRGYRRLRDVPVIAWGGTPAGRRLAGSAGPWHFMMGDCDHR